MVGPSIRKETLGINKTTVIPAKAGIQIILKTVCSFLCTAQRNEPKKSRPVRSCPDVKSGFPRRASDSGVVMNSHIWALRQHNDPAPLSCTRLGYYLNGVKNQNPKPKAATINF